MEDAEEQRRRTPQAFIATERDSNVPEFLEIGQDARILRYVPLLKLCALLPKSTLSSGCRTFTHAGNK